MTNYRRILEIWMRNRAHTLADSTLVSLLVNLGSMQCLHKNPVIHPQSFLHRVCETSSIQGFKNEG
jgi:hypothetical protein